MDMRGWVNMAVYTDGFTPHAEACSVGDREYTVRYIGSNRDAAT